ncbi:MAG TPA: pitrilysin family protein [Hyphomonadaceae bacterium]|nr:pitrilysin family protein [Hyphomonadaceae bacterium]
MILTQGLAASRFTRSIAAMVAAMATMIALPASAQNDPNWKPETFTLANGMKAVVLPDHRAPVVTHMLWYRVGSADEVKGKSGLAHFLEHLMFKATDDIPAGEFSKIVARNGGQDNASTSLDYTNYYFRIAKDRLPQMMRMEADRMVHLKLDEKEVIPELNVVREERRQNVESSPAAVLDEMVSAEMYAGHPYAIPVIGRMDELAKLTRDDAVDWYRTWYGPENAILVVAGDITAAELKPLAEDIYGAIPRRGDLKVRKLPAVQGLTRSVEVSHSDPKVSQASWSRSWLGVATGDRDAEALQVGIEILAGGRTSRLYRELNEQGEAVMSGGYSMAMEGRGIVSISATPAPGVSIEEIEAASAELTTKFLREGPTAEELERAKKMIAASAIFTRDNQMSMANWYGELLTAGQTVEQIEGWDERIRAVTAADVVRAMSRYLAGTNYVDAVLLPEGR